MLISRVTDPRNFELVGLPPADLLEDVVAAWDKTGVLDAMEILQQAVELTNEFVYDPGVADLRDRIKPRFVSTKMTPVKNRNLGEVPCDCMCVSCRFSPTRRVHITLGLVQRSSIRSHGAQRSFENCSRGSTEWTTRRSTRSRSLSV